MAVIAPKDFFVSYTSADRAWAEWIAWELEEAGYQVVIQAWDFLPGSNFVAQMRQTARTCRRTIAVLSPAYLRSLYAEAEWNSAFAQDPSGVNRALIPVRIERCELQGLDRPIVYLDLIGLPQQKAQEALLAGVSDKRNKPSDPPAFPGGSTTAKAGSPPFPSNASGPSQPRHVGILSTEFLDLSPEKDLTYEANELIRELGAIGGTTHLLDPVRIVLGVEDGSPKVGYADERGVNWDFFTALSILIVRRTRADDVGITDMIYDLLLFLPRVHPQLLVLDPPATFNRPLSKVPSVLVLSNAGVPQADGVQIARRVADKTPTFLQFPIVAKPSHGWRGLEVELCQTPAELTAYLRRSDQTSAGLYRFSLRLEERLNITEEFRVVVVGGTPVGCARKGVVPGRVARNIAVGSKWERAEDHEAMDLAARATAAFGYSFAGVDVARTETGCVVIECNRNPQFAGFDKATGESVARAMAVYAMAQLERAK